MVLDFRLERVMKIAESEKRNLEGQYQMLFDRFEQLARGLVHLIKEKESVESNLQDKMKKTITIDLMKRQIYDVEKMERLITEQTLQYDRVKNQLEQFKSILLKKAIEVKKYEKIKEKQTRIYRKEAKKKEMNLLDETAAFHSIKNV